MAPLSDVIRLCFTVSHVRHQVYMSTARWRHLSTHLHDSPHHSLLAQTTCALTARQAKRKKETLLLFPCSPDNEASKASKPGRFLPVCVVAGKTNRREKNSKGQRKGGFMNAFLSMEKMVLQNLILR